jgi:tetratricopeptide (TPR) repeat protein
LLFFERFDESISEILRARELDPLSPRIEANVGVIYLQARQFNKAVDVLEKAKRSNPKHAANYAYLGWTYAMMGEYEKSIEMWDIGIEITGGHPRAVLEKVNTLTLQGKKEEARNLMNDTLENSKQTFIPPILLAAIYGNLGEYDEAFDWLEEAYKIRDPKLCYLRVYPTFGSLRSDPRYKEMLKKVGLDK